MEEILKSSIIVTLLGVIIFFLKKMVTRQDSTNEKLEKVLVNDGKQDYRIQRVEDDVKELQTDVKQIKNKQ